MNQATLRRTALSLLAAAAGGLLGGSCTPGKPPAPRPDIVVVVWDTCRADRCSTFGHDRPTTPRLEELAATGVRYTRCFTPAPWTAPAHASLFTGLSPRHHGLLRGRGDTVHPGIPLLAETLSAAGYETVGISANAYVSDATGLSRGFRFFELARAGPGGKADGDVVNGALERWLAQRQPTPGKDGPFFIFLNYMDTHLPLAPPRTAVDAVRDPAVPEEWIRRSLSVDPRAALAHLLGIRKVDDETLSGQRVRYDGAVRHVDAMTREALDLLEARGLLRDAFLAVTSDHGENLGEHGLLDHRLSVHDTLLHVPLVVRWPGRFQGGGSVDRQVSLMDLYPTILAAARVPAPPGTGKDAEALDPAPGGGGRALLAEAASAEVHIEELSRGFPEAPPETFEALRITRTAVREPPDAPRARKLVRLARIHPEGDEEVVLEQLFDTAADPGETRDLLAGGDPAARADARRLGALLEGLRRPGR